MNTTTTTYFNSANELNFTELLIMNNGTNNH